MKKILICLVIFLSSFSISATEKEPNSKVKKEITNKTKTTETKVVKKEMCDTILNAEINLAFSNFNYLIDSTSTSSPLFYEYADYYFDMLETSISNAYINHANCNR